MSTRRRQRKRPNRWRRARPRNHGRHSPGGGLNCASSTRLSNQASARLKCACNRGNGFERLCSSITRRYHAALPVRPWNSDMRSIFSWPKRSVWRPCALAKSAHASNSAISSSLDARASTPSRRSPISESSCGEISSQRLMLSMAMVLRRGHDP